MTTVLIVDDQAIFREPIAAALRSRGYRATCVAGGEEAIEYLRVHSPDIMLLDIAMPHVSGIDVLERMRSDKSLNECPAILLTALAERESVLTARALGVTDYLLKSQFSLDELEARIERRLARSTTPESNVTQRTDGGDAPDLRPGSSAPQSAVAGESPDPTEQLKSLRPIMARSELEAMLDDCGELQGMSSTVSEILRLTRSASATTEQLAKVIRRDQGIALRVLKLANSVAYTRGEPVDSIDRAVLRIGMEAIGQAVLNLSVIDSLAADDEHGAIDVRQFWEHSIATGLIAAEIASAHEDRDVDRAFTLGLLHDVGKLIYLRILGARYGDVLRMARQLCLPAEDVESRMLLVNHAEAMNRILRAWQFPRDLVDPIMLHHHSVESLKSTASRRFDDVAILALADRLSHALLLGSSGSETLYDTIELCRALHLTDDFLQDIASTTPDRTDDLKIAMLNCGGVSTWKSRVEHWRGQLAAPLRIMVVSQAPAFDAVRICAERLSAPLDQPPDIAVVHVGHVRERVALSNELRAAEHEAGVSGIPVLILSGDGELQLEDDVMRGRAFGALSLPVRIERMIEALNAIAGPAAALAA